MEGASHIQMKGRSLFKSVDMFDFFIQHLSWYERRLDSDPAIKGTVTARLKHQTRTLTGVDNTGLGGPFEKNSYHNPLRQKNGQVLVVMPFYGAGKGSGNSDFSARATYLNMAAWRRWGAAPMGSHGPARRAPATRLIAGSRL